MGDEPQTETEAAVGADPAEPESRDATENPLDLAVAEIAAD